MSDLEAAEAAIRAGALVGVPTDTVYGLAVDPRRPGAVDSLFEAKQRARSSPLVILVATMGEAELWGRFSERAGADARAHWPGALTLIVEALIPLPAGVGDPEADTIGLRSPDHPTALALLTACGPLAVTSANRSGEPPAADATVARSIFGDAVAVYLEGASTRSVASTVVDYTKDPPVIMREGSIGI